MMVHRLDNGDPFAVEIRPGSTVACRTEGELVLVEISYPGKPTITIVLPDDVARSMLGALQA